MLYHVRVLTKSTPRTPLCVTDLTRDELQERVLGPHDNGRSLAIEGRSVSGDDLQGIRIIRTEGRAAAECEAYSGDPKALFQMAIGKDVTNDLITKPYGWKAESAPSPSVDPRKVVVVHGRDTGARDAMFDFLRALGLHPIEWDEAVHATGIATPPMDRVLTALFSDAQAVVVLMTPDDIGQLREEFIKDDDPTYERKPTGQARQNVIFEMGLAFGKYPDRTVIVQLGQIRRFTDIEGRHVVRLTNTPEAREEMLQRLEAAGCAVNRSGNKDWLRAGDFRPQPEYQGSTALDLLANVARQMIRTLESRVSEDQKRVSAVAGQALLNAQIALGNIREALTRNRAVALPGVAELLGELEQSLEMTKGRFAESTVEWLTMHHTQQDVHALRRSLTGDFEP
jgi:predicted nucleotide-binding protein